MLLLPRALLRREAEPTEHCQYEDFIVIQVAVANLSVVSKPEIDSPLSLVARVRQRKARLAQGIGTAFSEFAVTKCSKCPAAMPPVSAEYDPFLKAFFCVLHFPKVN